MINWLDYSH